MTEIHYDIVVAGGSFSAVATALAAARHNPELKVLLTEPTDWLGGQATTQGVSAIDNAWHEPGASLMREQPEDHYPKDYLQFIDHIKFPPEGAPGEGYAGDQANWVSREGFDPRTAAWILEHQVAQLKNITLMKNTVVKSVETSTTEDKREMIVSLTLNKREAKGDYVPFKKLLSQEIRDWYEVEDSDDYTKEQVRVTSADADRGMMVIDASELADVIVLSGADYALGRETKEEHIKTDGSLPEIDEDGTQAIVFTFCQLAEKGGAEPSIYDHFFADQEEYLKKETKSYYSLGKFTFEKIWTYRRLRNMGKPGAWDDVNVGDVTMQNWYPGNDYPYGSFLKSRVELGDELTNWKGGVYPEELSHAEKHAFAWHLYYKANNPTDLTITFLKGDHEFNMMGTPHGLCKFPYIRGTRRIIGYDGFRITSRDLVNCDADQYDGETSFRYFDSAGISSYAVDVHPVKNSEGASPPFEKAAPFYLPIRAHLSRNISNLLAAGKTTATTYITNAAYRLHPIEWVSGTIAGYTASYALSHRLQFSDLFEKDHLRSLQGVIAETSPISWKYQDKSETTEHLSDLIPTKGFLRGEDRPRNWDAYCPSATRVSVRDENGAEVVSAEKTGRHYIDIKLPNEADLEKLVCVFLDMDDQVLEKRGFELI